MKIKQYPKNKIEALNEGIIEQIIEVAKDSFGKSMGGEEIIEHVLPTDHLYLAFDSNNGLIGFCTDVYRDGATYFAGAAVKNNCQGNGVYQKLLSSRLNNLVQRRERMLEFCTQNPKVEKGICMALEREIDLGNLVNYNLERKIEKRLYGRMLTEKRLFSGNLKIDKIFAKLNLEIGDGFSYKIELVYTGKQIV
jgi:hypothetical protein